MNRINRALVSILRLVLPAAMLLANEAAHADWIEVDHSDLQTTYVEPVSIDSSGSKVSLWILSSYASPKTYEGKPFRSILSQYQYDCRNVQYRLLAYALRTESMGTGAELHSEFNIDDWRQVAAGSLDDKLWKKVCTEDGGWHKVGESGQMVVYANPYTMQRRSGGKVRMWELFDLKNPQQQNQGKSYLSVKHLAEYDCKGKRYRTVDVEYHVDNMGKGDEVRADGYSHNWEAVGTGSADQLFWNQTCEKIGQIFEPPKNN